MTTILVPISSLPCLSAWQDYRTRLVETFPVKEESTKRGRIALREAQQAWEFPGTDDGTPTERLQAQEKVWDYWMQESFENLHDD